VQAPASSASSLVATPWKESHGTCACCGQTSKTIWGDVSNGEATCAIYYIQWTVGAANHDVNIDLIIGPWGEGADVANRILVSVLYRPTGDGGAFMVIDANERLSAKSSVCGRAARRDEVIGTAFATEVFSLVDALWLTDPRVEEVQALCHLSNSGAGSGLAGQSG